MNIWGSSKLCVLLSWVRTVCRLLNISVQFEIGLHLHHLTGLPTWVFSSPVLLRSQMKLYVGNTTCTGSVTVTQLLHQCLACQPVLLYCFTSVCFSMAPDCEEGLVCAEAFFSRPIMSVIKEALIFGSFWDILPTAECVCSPFLFTQKQGTHCKMLKSLLIHL